MNKKQTPPHLVRVNTRKDRNAAIKAQAANRKPAAVIYEDPAKGTRQISINAAARKAYDLTIYTPAAVIFTKLGIKEY